MKLSTDKTQFQKKIAQRLRQAMAEQNISQTVLIQKAAAEGYTLRQSTLSKLLADGSSMNISTLVQIANTLHLDLTDLLSEDEETQVRSCAEPDTTSCLIRSPDAIQMKPYLNHYFTYFFPTLSTDDRILEGDLVFRPSRHRQRCVAEFTFPTGKLSDDGQPITKDYVGELVLSPIMSSAYCTLKNETFGEISYMMFKYIPILQERLECRVALVLTASAGSNRMPTAHRMIFSRHHLTPQELEFLKGHLYLNEAEILISQPDLKRFMEDPKLDDSFKKYFFGEEGRIGFLGTSPVPYYLFDESVIRGSSLPADVKARAICLIRQYSASPMYNKIGTKCDELVYRFIMDSQRQKREKA